MLITRYFVSCCYVSFCVVARHFVNIGTHNIINHLHTCKVVKVFGHNMAYVLRRLIDCVVHINVTLWLESIKSFCILTFCNSNIETKYSIDVVMKLKTVIFNQMDF